MMKYKELLKSVKKNLSTIKRAAKLIESFTPHFILHSFLFSFDENASKFLGLYLSAGIVDEITGNRNVQKLTVMVIALVLSELTLMLLSKYSWRRIRVNQIISKQWEEIYLNNKSFSMDYKNMEDPNIRTMRQAIADNRVNGGLGQLIMLLTFTFDTLLEILFGALIMSEIFIKRSHRQLSGILAFADSGYASFIFLIILFAATVIIYKTTKDSKREQYTIRQRMPRVDKIMRYYLDDYLDDSKALKDVHMFSQKEIIRRSSSKIYGEWCSLSKEYIKNIWGLEIHTQSVVWPMHGFVYAFVALKTLAGSFGIGGFIKYAAAIENLLWGILRMTGYFASFASNNKYIDDFFAYADYPSEMHYGTIPTEKRGDYRYDIEFHNVSFKYPHTEEYAVKNFSFKLKVGERMAVVGMNGSGKTTMIKLLCRLYDPTKGFITLNGIDIQKYDYEDYLALFSVVFQDFKLFSFSLGENVAASVDYDEKRVWDALETAGLSERVKSFPDALKTPVYKDFDENGVEISGGEAQKLAIARALYKDAPFVILDEPTASLDPLAEYEIYSRFNDMVGQKTAVYISHRLSSCRFCDKIAVFHEGEMIQFGSHDELLKDEKGKYHELWNAQAQYYTNEAG